jgi:serine/threonine protein kinase
MEGVAQPNAPADSAPLVEYPVPMGMNRHLFQSVIFDLPFKYQPIKMIGKGTYGSVISATNTQTSTQCAIKRLANIEDIVSKTP